MRLALLRALCGVAVLTAAACGEATTATNSPPFPSAVASAPNTPGPSSLSPTPQSTASPTTESPTASTGIGQPASNASMVVPTSDSNGAETVAGILYTSSGVTCHQGQTYSGCPITARLAQRLNSHPISSAEALCRCQNVYQSRTVTGGFNGPTVARVMLSFGQIGATLNVTVVAGQGYWLADDITCGDGAPVTSIYAPSPPSCS